MTIDVIKHSTCFFCVTEVTTVRKPLHLMYCMYVLIQLIVSKALMVGLLRTFEPAN